jgi:diaminopimelate decarboxylase
MIEPGRYLVGESGLYVTRVVDVKQSRGQTFVVLDGGMHHHAAATGNFGQTLRRPFPLATLNRLNAPCDQRVTLVGPLCTPLDTFARNLAWPEPRVGDLVGVFQSGAYARAASPLQFLGHRTPAETWVSAREARLIQPRGAWA